MRKESDNRADFRLANLAARKHSVLSTEELLALGLSDDSIPVTNTTRTLIDLRRVLDRESWEDAIDRARSLHLPTPSLPSTAPTRSNLERRLLALCRRRRLPLPETNVRIAPFFIDFLWRGQRLVVETDGYDHHSDRASFESDRARDARLTLMGYRVVRVTWRQLEEDGPGTAAMLRALLDVSKP